MTATDNNKPRIPNSIPIRRYSLNAYSGHPAILTLSWPLSSASKYSACASPYAPRAFPNPCPVSGLSAMARSSISQMWKRPSAESFLRKNAPVLTTMITATTDRAIHLCDFKYDFDSVLVKAKNTPDTTNATKPALLIDAGRTTMPRHPETDDSQNSILSYRFPESRHFHAAAKTTAMQTARNPP